MKKAYHRSKKPYSYRFWQVLLISILAHLTSYAQYDYNFNRLMENYNELTGDISLNNGLTWNDPNFIVPIGFQFEFMGRVGSTLNFGNYDGGQVALITQNPNELCLLGPMYEDIVDRGYDPVLDVDGQPGSLSKISYKTEGTVGHRIFKLQWQSAGFYDFLQTYGVCSEFVNIQLWLYEENGMFEFRYGPYLVTQPYYCYYANDGPEVGFGVYSATIARGYTLVGTPNAAAMVDQDTSTVQNLNGSISDGTVYRFTPRPEAVGNLGSYGTLSVFPNPTKGSLHIADMPQADIRRIQIFNPLGLLVRNIEPNNHVNLSELSTGLYLIKLETKDGIFSTTVSKN